MILEGAMVIAAMYLFSIILDIDQISQSAYAPRIAMSYGRLIIKKTTLHRAETQILQFCFTDCLKSIVMIFSKVRNHIERVHI